MESINGTIFELTFLAWVPRAAGACLVTAVSADAVAGRCAWKATPAAFLDCVCPDRRAALPLAVFIMAGIAGLARFQVEGLARGGDRGLPVTYNGYIFPVAALTLSYWPEWNSILLWGPPLPVAAALMVSAFAVPEIRSCAI